MIRRVLLLIPVMTLFCGCGDAGSAGTEAASSGSTGTSTGPGPGTGTSSDSSGETPTSTGTGAGTGTGTGTGTDSGDSSGGSSSGGADDPLMADPMCTSGKMWTQGNHESPYMHPGMACLTCHSQMEPEVADRFLVVGTVFPTGHEPDDCLGLDGPAAEATYVEITTADAKVIQLPVNSSGNFMYDKFMQGGAVKFPITAKVVKGDKERVMLSPQSTGDCNSCHTQEGTQSAPGRIVEPI